MINDLCLLTCTYRRPYLIEGLLKSWAITNDSTTNNIAIVENSPLNDVSEYLNSVGITYARFVNQAHADGILYGLSQVKHRYVLLLDTDILFRQSVAADILGFIESGCAIGGEYCAGRGLATHHRIHPWFCLIDMKQINDNHIVYARELGTNPFDNGYDTGSSFLEDILSAGMTYREINLQPHKFIHYEGMSWRPGCGQPSLESIDSDNERIYTDGLHKMSSVDITGFYSSVLS